MAIRLSLASLHERRVQNWSKKIVTLSDQPPYQCDCERIFDAPCCFPSPLGFVLWSRWNNSCIVTKQKKWSDLHATELCFFEIVCHRDLDRSQYLHQPKHHEIELLLITIISTWRRREWMNYDDQNDSFDCWQGSMWSDCSCAVLKHVFISKSISYHSINFFL
jgi:hypothetical protein